MTVARHKVLGGSRNVRRGGGVRSNKIRRLPDLSCTVAGETLARAAFPFGSGHNNRRPCARDFTSSRLTLHADKRLARTVLSDTRCRPGNDYIEFCLNT